MVSSWNQMFESMQQQVASRRANDTFQFARMAHEALSPYPGPEEALAALHSRKLAHEDCDAIFRAFLRCTRDDVLRPMAEPLLWTAMRPGLTAVLGRAKRFRADENDVVSAIQYSVTRQFRHFNLELERPICASILRAVETDVCRELASEQKAQQFRIDSRGQSEAVVEPRESLLGIEESGDFHAQVDSLRDRLVPILGAVDADLVIRVHVLDEGSRAASAYHGLSYEATRKRVQRATKRLFHEFTNLDVPFRRFG